MCIRDRLNSFGLHFLSTHSGRGNGIGFIDSRDGFITIYDDLFRLDNIDDAENKFVNIGFYANIPAFNDFMEFLVNLDFSILQKGAVSFPPICDYKVSFLGKDFLEDSIFVELPVFFPEADCPVMWVDIGAPFIRRCFDNAYTIQYCNYGSQEAKDAYIDLSFDESLELVSSELAYELIDNQEYRVYLGDVSPAFCGDFKMIFNASCESSLGATHCVEAKIFPDTLCSPVSDDWSGAALEVTGNCVGDSVQFQIQNVGDGDMLEPSNFIVIEDVILREEGEVQLLAQEVMQFSLPANGSFYRMQVDQVADFPFPSVPTASIEGCGVDENGNQSFGFVNQFMPDDLQPSVSIDCQQNIGAFDPNDKQVTPAGINAAHYTEKNIPLKYKIRFQNTGTDTACLLYTSPSPRDATLSRMPSSA